MPYFDCNATVPMHPAARAVWLDVSERSWHNPSGLHAAATAARDMLDDCRERLADLLGCDPARIVFTGGATAAANMVARHVAVHAPPDGRAILSAIEHPCVAESFAAWMPGRVDELPVDRHGVVVLDSLAEQLSSAAGRPAIVSVMAASNESGTIEPWQALSRICQEHGVPFHADAAQWLGKVPAQGLGECDWITGSGHKFGGPKGVGFLLTPTDESTFQGDRGGPQEHGRHAGTEDVAGIAAMVAALEAREAELASGDETRAAARDAAEERLLEKLPQAVIIGRGGPRLWNTLAVIIPGADGRKLVAALDRAGVMASTGSACSAGTASTPRIASAIGIEMLGITTHDMRGMVRLSGGQDTTATDWITAVNALIEAVQGDGSRPPMTSLIGSLDV